MVVPNYQSSSEALCDVSERRLFLQCEVVSLTPNPQAGGPLLVGCPRRYQIDIRIIEISADVLLNTCKDIGLAVNTGKTKYIEVGCHPSTMTNELCTVIVIRMKK